MVASIIAVTTNTKSKGIQIINDDVDSTQHNNVVFSTVPISEVVRKLIRPVICHGDVDGNLIDIYKDDIIIVLAKTGDDVNYAFVFQPNIKGYIELRILETDDAAVTLSVVYLDKQCCVCDNISYYGNNSYVKVARQYAGANNGSTIDNIEQFKDSFHWIIKDKHLWDEDGMPIGIRWRERELMWGGALHTDMLNAIFETLVTSITTQSNCSLGNYNFSEYVVRDYFSPYDNVNNNNFVYKDWVTNVNGRLKENNTVNIQIEPENKTSLDPRILVRVKCTSARYFIVKVDDEAIKCGILFQGQYNTLTYFDLAREPTVHIADEMSF
jgi:hypothetical protein